jgi:citrate synthase
LKSYFILPFLISWCSSNVEICGSTFSKQQKIQPMTPLTSSQAAQEQKSWERSLQFFKQENALLKYRLSEMVDISEGNGFLQLAEYFQNKFLQKDAKLEKLIKKLREEVLQIEKDFLALSKEFNEKISQKI